MPDVFPLQRRCPVLFNGDLGVGGFGPFRNVGEGDGVFPRGHALDHLAAVERLPVKAPLRFLRTVDCDGDRPGLRGNDIRRLNRPGIGPLCGRNFRGCPG